MSANTDKNLLFGLIAFQNGYITMEQFMEAGAKWSKDPNRQLAEILLELKYIEDVERHNIQGIVDDRVRRLGGLENSISFSIQNGSVPDGQGMPEDWKSKIEDVTKIIQNNATPSPPRFTSTAEQDKGIHRYIIRKTLGHGGQGYVWEAFDTELNRRVAIKNIVPKLSSDPLHQELLIDEARKTGKLAHAGIPPVFDMGKDAEGKPFFTMQLISGEKLSERCNEIRYEGISQSEFVNQIRPLLRHLITACNTLQFAFDNEAVIHRDLKPENIMVNQYGETLVMDWGMGKIIDDPSNIKDDASSVLFIPIQTDSGSSQRTSVGTIKGSVKYMSPEQARAENDRLDHRTDVYGLGAILYWILTGQPPHKGTLAALPDIQKNLFPTPSQAQPSLSIPRELEAICLKAMASAPENRYQRAGDLAADLDNFIAGEPVSALPDNALRKAERFLRKHARAVIASLLGLTVAVFGLSVANGIISRQKSEIKSQLTKIKKLASDVTSSRRVASNTLDHVIGKLFDNRLSQLPGSGPVRLKLLEEIADQTQAYITENPEDIELKLDLVRLLTRLAKLEAENNQNEDADKHWKRAEELLNETKEQPDQVFQENWKRAFWDMAYYRSSFDLSQGRVGPADEIIKQAVLIAEQYRDSFQNDPVKTREFVPAMIRLYRQRARVNARDPNWQESVNELSKAVEVLRPFVDKHIPGSSSEPKITEKIDDLNYAELGYFLLLSDDLGDYETVLEKYQDAEKTFEGAFRASLLAPRVENAQRDGTILRVNMLRKLQRLALMTKDFPKADKYYQDALKFCEKERSEEPLTERHWLFLECDRARGLAKTKVKEASEAFARASEAWVKISTSDALEFQTLRGNPKTVAEIEYSLAAAKVAIAKANPDTDPAIIEQTIKEQEELKAKKLQTLKDNNASPFTLRELMFLP
jgi:serine/threonine protein kinase